MEKVRSNVASLRPQANIMSMKLQRVRARAAAAVWRRDAKGLKESLKRSKRVAYDSGCLGETLFLQLLALDNVTGSDDVRKARKELVLCIKGQIKETDLLRAQALKLQQFVE